MRGSRYWDDKFFGRKPILDLLKKRLLGLKEGYRQNIAILGGHYLGKTTILNKFLADLDDKDIVEVYLDLGYKDFRQFFLKYAGTILHNYSRGEHLPLHDDINLLLASVKSRLPQTSKVIQKIQADVEANRLSDACQSLMKLPEIFTFEANKFCLFIFDEFHKMEDLGVENIFQQFGTSLMTQRRCLYVVTSSCAEKAKAVLSEKLSLLFGNFEIVSIGPFDLKTSQEFIASRLEDIQIGVPLKDFLIDFTGGHPLYLQQILKEIRYLAAVHKQQEVFAPILVQAIENTIFDPWGVLSRHFELLVDNLSSGKGNNAASPILIALANGKLKLSDLTKSLAVKQTLISQKAARLLAEGVIAKNGNFYYLEDKLLRYWLKYVLERRLTAVSISAERQRKAFAEDLEKLIETFLTNAQKDLASRIIELLRCFDNESVSVNGRKYKLPTFNKITTVKFDAEEDGRLDAIKAFSAQGQWFVLFKKDKFAESDVSAFVAQTRKLPNKPSGCIIISLSDLDENTRVKALQERMWIWNENELNALLNFFDQPYIVIDDDRRSAKAV